MSADAPLSSGQLDSLAEIIDQWAEQQSRENPAVVEVVRDEESGERRWFVRLHGEQKDVFSVWFHLRQRNLHVETYLMPAPETNEREFYEHLMRRNATIAPFRCCIGAEEAIYLVAEVPNRWVDQPVLDELLGGAYEYTERCFRPAMRLGLANRLPPTF